MSSCREGSSGAGRGCEKGKLTCGVQRTVPTLEFLEIWNSPTLKKRRKKASLSNAVSSNAVSSPLPPLYSIALS